MDKIVSNLKKNIIVLIQSFKKPSSNVPKHIIVKIPKQGTKTTTTTANPKVVIDKRNRALKRTRFPVEADFSPEKKKKKNRQNYVFESAGSRDSAKNTFIYEDETKFQINES